MAEPPQIEEPHPNLLKIEVYISWDNLKPLKEFDADVCIHIPEELPEPVSYKDLFLHEVEGTINVVDAAKNCRQLIFISSSSVYKFNGLPVKESEACIENQLSDHGETKLLAEEVIGYEIPIDQKRLILRPRAIYGVGDQMLLPRLFNLLKNKTIFCPVPRQVETSLTHIDNLAYAIDLFLMREDAPNLQVLNVADEEPYDLCNHIQLMLTAIEEQPLKIISIPFKALNVFERLNSKLNFIKRLNPILMGSVNKTSILDLHCIKKELQYKAPRNLNNSYAEIAEWIQSLGGKSAYLNQLNAAPWLVKL